MVQVVFIFLEKPSVLLILLAKHRFFTCLPLVGECRFKEQSGEIAFL
jgi:hypothetical protein